MTDDKDPALVRLFAEDADPTPPPDFALGVQRQIARLRRRRAVLAGAAIALSGALVLAAARLVGPLMAPTGGDPWLNSPAVMAVGASLVLLVVISSRRRLRRR